MFEYGQGGSRANQLRLFNKGRIFSGYTKTPLIEIAPLFGWTLIVNDVVQKDKSGPKLFEFEFVVAK